MQVTSKPRRLTRSSGAVLVLIVAIAGVLSLGVYEYSVAVANSISNSSVQSVHTNSEIQARDISNLVVAKLQSISTSLVVMSNSSVFASGNLTAVQNLLDAAQSSTSAFTYAYTWDNASGVVTAGSNRTTVVTAQQEGINVSERTYFVLAKSSGQTYFDSSVISVLSGDQYVVISQPLYLQGKTFNGILTASISLTALGGFLESQVSPNLQGTFGLISSTGIILYSQNESEIGLNVLGSQIQSLLPASLKGPFDQMINSSLAGNSGVEDFSSGAESATLAYQPVMIPTATGQGTQGQNIGTVYVAAPDNLAAAQAVQISQLEAITSLTILAISGSAFVAALVVLRWNWRLDLLVKERTVDLEARTEELSKANTQLAARDEAQRDFINIAAHELRTPVQPLLGLTDIMQDSASRAGVNGKVEVSTFEVEMLARNTRRLEALTENILDASRVDTGMLRLNKERFELNSHVKEIIAEVTEVLPTPPGQARRNAKETMVKFLPSADPLYVDADKTRVFELLSNLVKNAITFSEGRVVEVSSHQSGQDAVVRVRDHGTGIDPEIMTRLFTKFSSKSPAGLGLGLYISKGIVNAHGGRIWAENNTDGLGGASLFFSLPIASP